MPEPGLKGSTLVKCSNTHSCFSGGMPMPVSLTLICNVRRDSSLRQRSVMRPAAVNLAALCSRLSTTRVR